MSPGLNEPSPAHPLLAYAESTRHCQIEWETGWVLYLPNLFVCLRKYFFC